MTEQTKIRFEVGEKVKIRKKAGPRSFYPPEEGKIIKIIYPKIYIRNDQGQTWVITPMEHGGYDEIRKL